MEKHRLFQICQSVVNYAGSVLTQIDNYIPEFPVQIKKELEQVWKDAVDNLYMDIDAFDAKHDVLLSMSVTTTYGEFRIIITTATGDVNVSGLHETIAADKLESRVLENHLVTLCRMMKDAYGTRPTDEEWTR